MAVNRRFAFLQVTQQVNNQRQGEEKEKPPVKLQLKATPHQAKTSQAKPLEADTGKYAGPLENLQRINIYIPSDFMASYTRNAGHTRALRNPRTPIQKPVACEIK
jgi:hypothetical protein